MPDKYSETFESLSASPHLLFASNALTRRELVVIGLNYCLGLSTTDIAEVLGISTATVFRARRSALSKLRELRDSTEVRKDDDERPSDVPASGPKREPIVDSPLWDSPRVKAILERPPGAPIDLSGLTEEERDALLAEAKGMWADHPDIKDSVKWVRELREGLSKRF